MIGIITWLLLVGYIVSEANNDEYTSKKNKRRIK